MDIDFAFACRDDCLDKMVPSDLRILVAERDHLTVQNKALTEALEHIAGYTGEGPITTPWQAIVKDLSDVAKAALAA